MTIGVPRIRAGVCLPLLAVATAYGACGSREAAEEAVDFLLELLRPPATDTVPLLRPPATDTVPKSPG